MNQLLVQLLLDSIHSASGELDPPRVQKWVGSSLPDWQKIFIAEPPSAVHCSCESR